ncbi:MAG: regulatory protein GemA [Betaproteobacteria bacterium]|nr:MAG: regulatory protein GemA [Betaproteobacteria bacterium]
MTASPDTRRRELAQIHIAKAQLGMAEDSYRQMLWTVGRVRSAGDLDWAGRKAVLDHLKACGFKARKSTKKVPPDTGWGWVNNASEDRKPMLRKIAVMLKDANREKAYADAIAKQMFGVDLVEFCKPDQLHRIVAAMVKDQNRRAAKAAA